MSYCINPRCSETAASSNASAHTCSCCGAELLLSNRYRVKRLLGEGGFGKTFEVEDVLANSGESGSRKVLKVLLKTSDKAVELFQREADVLSRLQHPGIPRVEPDGYFTLWLPDAVNPLHCLAMEFIEGQNLQKWVEEQKEFPLSGELAFEWLKQLVEILHALHQQQYFHRDIKPENIMLTPCGQLVLIDFGAVREVTDTMLAKLGALQAGITSLVSIGYTPTEQINGKAVPQSDFFALGRTFVYLLTGEYPPNLINSETDELVWRDRSQPISPALAYLIDWMMAASPGQRPQNTALILQYLEKAKLAGDGQFSAVDARIPPLAKVESSRFRFGSILSYLKEVRYKKVKGVFALVLLGAIGFRLVSHQVAIALNDRGVEHYPKERAAAIENIKRSLQLNPKNMAANYNWGRICEDLQDFDCAREKYLIAARGGEAAAYSNLARLYIIREKNYAAAVNLSWQGLASATNDKVKSSLYKNLGWARLQQKRYSEAKEALLKSLELDENKAAAYCLLAQVSERLGNLKNSLVEWEACREFGDVTQPDEDTWMGMASQRLAGEKAAISNQK